MSSQKNDEKVSMAQAEVSDPSVPDDHNQADIPEVEAPILMLKVDHFEEIFDFLGLEDLNAISQSCTRLQQVAGYYFKEHFFSGIVDLYDQELILKDTEVNGFRRFIKNIMLLWGNIDEFRYIGSNNFDSLKHIVLRVTVISTSKIEVIKKNLGKILKILPKLKISTNLWRSCNRF